MCIFGQLAPDGSHAHLSKGIAQCHLHSLHGVWSDLLNWMNLVCYHIVRRFWGRKLWFCLKSMILQFKFCDSVQKQPCPVQGRTFPRVKFCKFGWITKIANFKPCESFMWCGSLCSGCCGVGRLPSSMFFTPFSYPMYCFPRVLLSCWPPTRVAPYWLLSSCLHCRFCLPGPVSTTV